MAQLSKIKVGSTTYNVRDDVHTWGGRNLLKFTDWYVTGVYGLSNCTMNLTTDASAPGGKVLRLTLTDSTKNAHCYLSSMKSRGGMVSGETYIASLYVRASAAMSRPTNQTMECSSNLTRINNVNITTGWVQQGIKFVYNPNASYQAWYFIYPALWSGLSNGKYIDIAGVKLEHGNKITDWSPAPEDIAHVNGECLELIS